MLWKKRNGKLHRFTWRQLVLMALIIIACDIGFAVIFYLSAMREEFENVADSLMATQGGVSLQMTSHGLFLEREAQLLAQSSRIQNLLVLAESTLDEEGVHGGPKTDRVRSFLLAYLEEHYRRDFLKKETLADDPISSMPGRGRMRMSMVLGESRIHVVSAKAGVSLLDSRDPKAVGPNPATFNNLIGQVGETGRSVHGIDVGPRYAGIRAVAPVFENGTANGRIVGYVEVGQSFDTLLQRIRNLLKQRQIDVEFAVLFKKEAAALFRAPEDVMAASLCVNNYEVVSSTTPIPRAICESNRFLRREGKLPDSSLAKGPENQYIVGAVSDPLSTISKTGQAANASDLVFVAWFTVTPEQLSEIAMERIKSSIFFGIVAFGVMLLGISLLWHIAGRKLNRLVLQRTEELAEANRKLVRAKEGAEAANRAKSVFLASMSHEIRTPMNAIIGIGDLMAGTELNARQLAYLDTIRSSSRSLLELLNDILDFSKIEAGQLDIDPIPFQLRGVIDEVIDNFRGKIEAGTPAFSLEVSASVPDGLVGDPLRLRQVLVNLVGNAFKFTEEGDIRLSVSGRVDEKGRHLLTFTVSDSGIGIEPEAVENLFQAFTQADGSITRKYGGTGLGLSISQRLVTMMGGSRIRVESTPGRGSAFSFDCPFEASGLTEEGKWVVPAELSQSRILLVAAEGESRSTLKKMVSEFGLKFECAASLPEAERMLNPNAEASGFSLAIVDEAIPAEGEEKTIGHLASRKEAGRFPVVLAVSHGEAEEGTADGNDAVCVRVQKPIRPSALFDAIMECMGLDLPQRTVARPETFRKTFLGVSVLLAEDNAANQMVACEILRQAGFVVDVAENGREAVEMSLEKRYAVVLMDLQMPEMDGLKATRQIRKHMDKQMLPIVAMTANALPEDRQRCLDAGMNDYISKPIDSMELLRILETWVAPADAVRTGKNKSAPVVAGDSPPESIPGVEIASGMKRLGLPWESFRRMLEGFVRSQQAEVAGLAEDADSGKWHAVGSRAHALKGAAGNMAATGLQMAAKKLEKAVKKGEFDRVGKLVRRIETEFRQIARSVSEIKTVGTAGGDRPAPTMDSETFAAFLGRLKPCIADFDPVGAHALVDAVDPASFPKEFRQEGARLIRAVRELEYKTAMAILEKIGEGSEPNGESKP